jgi:hypothetical protein
MPDSQVSTSSAKGIGGDIRFRAKQFGARAMIQIIDLLEVFFDWFLIGRLGLRTVGTTLDDRGFITAWRWAYVVEILCRSHLIRVRAKAEWGRHNHLWPTPS